MQIDFVAEKTKKTDVSFDLIKMMISKCCNNIIVVPNDRVK